MIYSNFRQIWSENYRVNPEEVCTLISLSCKVKTREVLPTWVLPPATHLPRETTFISFCAADDTLVRWCRPLITPPTLFLCTWQIKYLRYIHTTGKVSNRIKLVISLSHHTVWHARWFTTHARNKQILGAFPPLNVLSIYYNKSLNVRN